MMRALRFLRQSPALAAAAIASLALGIAANVTIYSVVREMVLEDLSAAQPERLVRLDGQATFEQYRRLHDTAVFRDLAFQLGLGDTGWRTASGEERIWKMETSANFFHVLGVRAFAGRLYAQADETRAEAVISYGFWRRRLAADPQALGRSMELGGRLYSVVGILPPDYRSVMGHGVSPEVYFPAAGEPKRCNLFGRLRDGVTRDQTSRALLGAARRIGTEEFARAASAVRPMAGLAANADAQGDGRRFFLFFVMLYAVAGMLALIACSNGASLLLARGVSRTRELAIRKALGAGRLQLARPLLAEGAALVALGTAAGLAVDAFLRNLLRGLRWPSAYNIPIEFHFQTDRGLLWYALLSAGAALAVTSVIPAWRASRADAAIALKQGDPVFSLRRWNLRNGLVLAQVVLATVLLLLGALFTRSFLTLAGSGAGFDDGHILIAAVRGGAGRDTVVRRLEAVPGVVGVTSIRTLPLMGELPLVRVRRDADPGGPYFDAYAMGAGERYFATLNLPVLRGRDFEIRDRERKPVPSIVSRSLAQRLFGNADPLGARLRIGIASEDVVEVVGVAADARLRSLGEDHEAALYTPYFEAQLLVRVSGAPARWLPPLRAVLSELDPKHAPDVHPMSDAVEGALFPMRMASALVGSLSVAGMLLSLAGLYGSVSYSVARRTREMGIRAALGATAARVTWTALRDGAQVLAIGGVIGMALGMAAIRPLVDLLPDGMNVWDARMLLLPAVLLLAFGLTAAWLPSRRAGRVDPAIALREE